MNRDAYDRDDYIHLEKGEEVLEGHFFYDIDGNRMMVDETDIGKKNGASWPFITYYKCKHGHQLKFPFYDKVRSYHPNYEPEWE